VSCRGPSVTAARPSTPRAVRRARSLLLVSDGGHADQEALLEKARESMEARATGLIFGRNVFQRGHDESLRFVAQLKEILAKYPS
jgi:class I fructose-bisphosphate aldolase